MPGAGDSPTRRAVPITADKSKDKRYVTAARRKSVTTPDGMSTIPSVKLVQMASLKKEQEKLLATNKESEAEANGAKDANANKDDNMPGPPRPRRGDSFRGSGAATDNDSASRSTVTGLASPPSSSRPPGGMSPGKISPLAAAKGSRQMPRPVSASSMNGLSPGNRVSGRDGVGIGDAFQRQPSVGASNFNSSGSNNSSVHSAGSALQQMASQATVSTRRADLNRSESRKSILEIRRLSSEELPTTLLASAEGEENTLDRRPKSWEVPSSSGGLSRTPSLSAGSPARQRVNFTRPQTAVPSNGTNRRSLQSVSTSMTSSPTMSSQPAHYNSVPSPSTPEKPLQLQSRPQTASGVRSLRNGRPTSASVSPSGRSVISSWSPGNAGLHWHEDLTGVSHDHIPDWVWQRQNLRILLIGRNKLSFISPGIGNLQHLRELSAFNNQLSELPEEIFNLKLLQRLDISFNEIEAISEDLERLTELRHALFSHNMITALPKALTTGKLHQLQVLNAAFNRLTDLPRNWEHLPHLQELNVSYNQLTSVPSQIRLLEHLITLDVSHNRLKELPITELKLMLVSKKGQQGKLSCIECKGNPQLVRPPPEINEQGGKSVAVYLRASVSGDEEMKNTDMVLVVFGERGSGKTSMVNALLAEDNISPEVERNTSTVGVEFSTWTPETELSYHVIDLTGQEISSNVLQLFLVRRAVYVFVWAVRQSQEGTLPEWEVMHMQTTVTNWIDSLQHRVPGASMVFVATHVDTVPPSEVEWQCDLIREAACTRQEQHREGLARRGASQEVPILHLFHNGHSLQINSLEGDGVAILRKELIQFTKSTDWYCEPIPATYIRLRDTVQQMGSSDKKEFLSWKEYQSLAHDCGIVGSDHLRIATLFLNDMGVLRYFGNVDTATSVSEKFMREGSIENLVFISLRWIVNVMKGLFKPDRDSLLDFFSRGNFADKSMYLRVRRLLTHGVIHPTLVPFLWPRVPNWPGVSPKAVEEYWSTHDLHMIAWSQEGLQRVLRLVEGLDIGAVSDSEQQKQSHEVSSDGSALVVPGLLSRSHRFRVDARVFGDDCLFRCDIEYLTVPPGFFEKLLVSLRKHANHMDFNTRSAAFYKMGTKLQVFMSKSEVDPKAPSCITVLFSQTKLWKHFKADLLHVERFFPGLHRAGFSFHVARSLSSKRALLVESASEQKASVIEEEVCRLEVELERVKNPVQVLISHSNTSATVASALASALRSLDKELEVVQEVPNPDEETIDARVMLACVDAEYATTNACLEQFRAQVNNYRSIIPMIMPGYEMEDFSQWWPSSMPEMQQFSLFMDLRAEEWTDLDWKVSRKHYYKMRGQVTEQLKRLATTGDSWAVKELAYAFGDAQKVELQQRLDTVKNLHVSIRKLLEEWRGSTPLAEGASSDSNIQDIPCVECIRQGDDKPSTLSRQECLQLLEKSKKGTFREKGERMYISNPTVTCANGHELGVNTVLSSAVLYDSVSCPSCIKNGITPPWCFNRHECLSYFDENDTGRVGSMTCPKCMKRGLPAVRILDILCPEIFLSYQWGLSTIKDGQQVFSTQELVKQYRKQIEVQTDVLCWLDVAGGLSAGDGDHMKRIEAGIEKSVVMVIFLSDAYINSENCRFELSKGMYYGKFIIPVLVPPEKAKSDVGWTGPGPEDKQWWFHAKKIGTRGTKKGQLEVDWEALENFEAVDLRKMSAADAQREITKRILGRFFRANQVVKPVSKAKKVWKKLNMLRVFGFARGASRKNVAVV